MKENVTAVIGGVLLTLTVVVVSGFIGKPVINVLPSNPAINVTPSVTVPGENFGAVASPDLPSPYFQFGGVRTWAYASTFASGQSTSTLCSILTPPVPTQIVGATAKVTSMAAYATNLKIYRAATPATETTVLAQLDIAGATAASVVATTTATALTDGVVAANSYINFRLATTTAVGPGFAPVGRCSVVLREI